MIRLRRIPALFAGLLLVMPNAAAPQEPLLDSVLRFEKPVDSGVAAGWVGGPRETLSVDMVVVHGGHAAGRIVRAVAAALSFFQPVSGPPRHGKAGCQQRRKAETRRCSDVFTKA